MTFQEFLKNSGAAFIKATSNNNGLNIRNSEGRVVATFLMENVPAEEDILPWVKEHFNYTVVTSAGSNIIRLNAPVDKGVALASLWDESPTKVSRKKVKA